MTAMKEPGPRWNGEPGEQLPSRDSVVFNVPPTAEQCERVSRLRRLEADEASRKAARELDELIEDINSRPLTDEQALARNESITRRTANDLAAQGWAVDYLARRFGLPVRQGVAA